MIYKVDMHTHSVASPDGGLTDDHYQQAIATGQLDCIAITDHNTIDFAQRLHEKLGASIIVGEEITTLEGELIGLFLQDVISPGLSAAETIKRIHEQGGLVYIPHPFETVRKGVSVSVADAIVGQADIVEVHNGRAVFQNRSAQVRDWALMHAMAGAASSDSHGRYGWGRTYTEMDAMPTRGTLVTLLDGARYHSGFPGVRGMLHPKINRLKKWSANRHAR